MAKRRGKPAAKPPSKLDSKLPLKSDHSIELVMTAIAATMFEIVWSRSVFPLVKWDSRIFDPTDPETSYESFISGAVGAIANYEAYRWNVPKRGQHPGLDKLIDCIESGTREALEKGYLAKLQLSFHTNDDGPIREQNFIESYTMTFEYGGDGKIPYISAEIRDGPTIATRHATIFDGKNDLSYLIRGIINSLSNFNHLNKHRGISLPDNTRMSMLIQYDDNTPDDYEAPMFRRGDENITRLLDLGEADDRHIMRTGFHTVSVSLALPGTRMPPFPISQSIEDQAILAASTFVSIPRHEVKNSQHHRTSRRNDSLTSISDGGCTQPEAMRQIEAVGVTRVPNSATQDTQPLDGYITQLSHEQPSPLANAGEDFPALPTFPPYVDYICADMKTLIYRLETLEGNRRSQGDQDLDQPQGSDDIVEYEVNCECGSKAEEGQLVKCVHCHGFQHIECYGYLDNKQPDILLCYTCLAELYPIENVSLDSMRNLCVARRALRYFYNKQSLMAIQELAQYLNITPKETQKILDKLTHEGHLVAHRKPSKGRKNAAEPIFTCAKNAEAICKNYFHPKEGVAQLFEEPGEAQSEGTMESGSVAGETVHGPGSVLVSQDATQVDFIDGPRGLRRMSLVQRAGIDDSSTQSESSPQSSVHHLTRSRRCFSKATDNSQNMGVSQLVYGEGISAQEIPGVKPARADDSQNSIKINNQSKKRAGDTDLRDPVKRPKTGGASPWLIRRKTAGTP